jgi:hypothetical protein
LGLWGLFAISRKPRGVFATLQGGGVLMDVKCSLYPSIYS